MKFLRMNQYLVVQRSNFFKSIHLFACVNAIFYFCKFNLGYKTKITYSLELMIVLEFYKYRKDGSLLKRTHNNKIKLLAHMNLHGVTQHASIENMQILMAIPPHRG